MSEDLPLKIGIIGLGNAARTVLPALQQSNKVIIAGAADHRSDARAQFREAYGQPAFETLDELVENDVDVVWVATPNEYHAKHAVVAAQAGKHVICEKPMALTLLDCDRMIDAAAANDVKLLLGHSKTSEAPIRKMRQILDSGVIGKVIQISNWNFNDWLQRPRLTAEVDTDRGGGICYRQAPHQIDIVRYLIGRPARSIRAVANRADQNFQTEGNFSALIEFDGGIAASIVYNAYGYFDISELTWNIGEVGDLRPILENMARKPRRTGAVDGSVRYGTAESSSRLTERKLPFYGLTVVSCENGIIRQSPNGLFVYDEHGRHEVLCDAAPSIVQDIEELLVSIREDRSPLLDGIWGKATLEICLALLKSSQESREVTLLHQEKLYI